MTSQLLLKDHRYELILTVHDEQGKEYSNFKTSGINDRSFVHKWQAQVIMLFVFIVEELIYS